MLCSTTGSLSTERSLDSLPSGLMHADLFPDNALWKADDHLVAIVDWEEVSAGTAPGLGTDHRPVCVGLSYDCVRLLLPAA
jgi:hypothetical protein